MNESLNLRLLIVGSDPLARAGLSALLDNQPGCAVVGQVADDDDWLDAVDIYQPDLILYDLGWNSHLELTSHPAFGEIGLPVVGLIPDETLAGPAWSAGIHSLLPRDSGVEKLVAALTATSQALTVLDPTFTPTLITPPSLPNPSEAVEALTPRELEVLQLVAEGLPNKSIGRRLDISEHTVKFHVNAIMGKLSAQSRTEAAVRATQLGLILL